MIGPLADDRIEILGPWHALGKAEDTISFLAGLRAALPSAQIDHECGCGIVAEADGAIDAAVAAAEAADIVLLCIGEESGMSGEAGSRAYPGLPECQRRLADAVLASGKPVVVALSAGRPLTVPWLFQNAGTVLATWLPGTQAGPALADILTGKCNPSGKLPVSWPVDVGQIPIFYAHRPTGRPAEAAMRETSKYLDIAVEPLFPFGHGLSYTRFAYRGIKLSAATMRLGQTLMVEAEIANEGGVDGRETALLFIRDPVASVARPVLELKGMAQIDLAAGASGTVRFELSCEDLSFPDDTGAMILEPGTWRSWSGRKRIGRR